MQNYQQFITNLNSESSYQETPSDISNQFRKYHENKINEQNRQAILQQSAMYHQGPQFIQPNAPLINEYTGMQSGFDLNNYYQNNSNFSLGLNNSGNLNYSVPNNKGIPNQKGAHNSFNSNGNSMNRNNQFSAQQSIPLSYFRSGNNSSEAGINNISNSDFNGNNSMQQANIHQKEKISIVDINTRNRDKNKDAKPNDFEVTLGKIFTNVKKIELVSTEIPNTDNVIKDLPIQLQNNIITWENAEDIDLNFYTNLTINTIVNDSVDITLPNHSFSIGSKLDIHIYNSQLNSDIQVTGFIDGDRQVTVIDSNTLRFTLLGGIPDQGICSINTGYPRYSVNITPGNYSAITLATRMSTDLGLIKRRNGNGQFHYFDVSVNLDTDILLMDSVIITQLGTDPLSTTAGSTIISVHHLNHGLKTGDRVKMVDVRNLAGINSTDLNGDFYITVLDFNTYTYEVITRANSTTIGGGTTTKSGRDAPFRLLFDSANTLIQYNIGYPNEDSTEAISSTNTDPITTKTLSIVDAEIINNKTIRFTTTESVHGLDPCHIINITSIGIGHNPKIITATPHLIQLPIRVTIRNTNAKTKNSLANGTHIVSPTGLNTLILEGVDISTAGNTGQILYGGDSINIYNLTTIPNIDKVPEFCVENVPNPDQFDITFFITSIDQESISKTVIGTSQVFVNHPNHLINNISSITQVNGTFANCKTELVHTFLGERRTLVNIIDGPLNSNTVDLIMPSHGLVTSDPVIIRDSTTVPVTDGPYKAQVLDSDTIRINYVHATFTTGTATILTGSVITITNTNSLPKIDGTYNLHNRELINGIGTGLIGSEITINTINIHNWSIGDQITISGTDCVPSIDSIYTIINIPTSTSLTVNLLVDVTTPGTTGVIINNSRFFLNPDIIFITPGISTSIIPAGIIGRNQSIILYRITGDDYRGNTLGGIPLQVLNAVYRNIERLIDINNYMIRINNNYATKTITSGGSDVRISSLQHGMRSIQANTYSGTSTGKLYRSIKLVGDEYIFLVSQGLDTIQNNSNIQNVFAKLLLSEIPGFLIHNGFVSEPKVFDTPLAVLSTLRFQVVTIQGYLFDFNDIDFSFSLRITEIINEQETANISARTGRNELGLVDTRNSYY